MKKKIWSKPEFTRIKLEPTEAVARDCKKITHPHEMCLPGGRFVTLSSS